MGDKSVVKKATLMGIITAVQWDEDDNVTSISLSTPEEEEYIIKDNSIGEELLCYVYQQVKVAGLIEEDEYGEKMINVESYEVFEED